MIYTTQFLIIIIIKNCSQFKGQQILNNSCFITNTSLLDNYPPIRSKIIMNYEIIKEMRNNSIKYSISTD